VSYEDGEHGGLGILPGKVVRFDFSGLPNARELKVPHMGWNQVNWCGTGEDALFRTRCSPAFTVSPVSCCPLIKGLDSGTYFYFVHSYYVIPADPEVASGRCNYGHDFTAMVWRDNLYATQFHPEKSQEAGLRLLRNFAEL
jgi:glutamine amidotransferase